MTRRVEDSNCLATMRRLDPAPPAELRAALGEEETEAALRRAIALGETLRQPVPAGDAFAAGSEPAGGLWGVLALTRRPVAALASVGIAALIAVGLLLAGAFSGRGSHPAYAAAAVAVAEANPRLLVTAPGWQVTDAGEFEPDAGETTFSDGTRTLTVHWYPARLYRSYLRDRAEVSTPRHSRLLGRAATTVDYGRGEYATMLAPIGAVFVEVRGRLGGRAAYDAALRSLRRVSVDAWLAAMPARVVGPGARARVVGRMLHGIPLPPGFSTAALSGDDAVLNHYALGVRVADAVACGWVESWLAARKGGDSAAARRAVAAMSGSGRWPLLQQMEREVPGGWADNVRHVARQLAAGRLDWSFGEALVRPDGSGYRLGPDWATAIQCANHIRRRPFRASRSSGGRRP